MPTLDASPSSTWAAVQATRNASPLCLCLTNFVSMVCCCRRPPPPPPSPLCPTPSPRPHPPTLPPTPRRTSWPTCCWPRGPRPPWCAPAAAAFAAAAGWSLTARRRELSRCVPPPGPLHWRSGGLREHCLSGADQCGHAVRRLVSGFGCTAAAGALRAGQLVLRRCRRPPAPPTSPPAPARARLKPRRVTGLRASSSAAAAVAPDLVCLPVPVGEAGWAA